MEDLITADYVATRLSCPPSDVEDALALLGFEPKYRLNGRTYWPGHAIARVLCYLTNSGRASFDITVPAESMEVSDDG